MTIPLVPMPQAIIEWQPWIAGWHTAGVTWFVAGMSLTAMCFCLIMLTVDKDDKFFSSLVLFFLAIAILSLIFGALFIVPALLAIALGLVILVFWGINIAINNVFFKK